MQQYTLAFNTDVRLTVQVKILLDNWLLHSLKGSFIMIWVGVDGNVL